MKLIFILFHRPTPVVFVLRTVPSNIPIGFFQRTDVSKKGEIINQNRIRNTDVDGLYHAFLFLVFRSNDYMDDYGKTMKIRIVKKKRKTNIIGSA